jgi:hypothetical protein
VDSGAAAYSLGNFVFSSDIWQSTNSMGKPFVMNMTLREEQRRGAVLRCTVRPGNDVSTSVTPTYIQPDGSVVPDVSLQTQRELKRRAQELHGPLYRARWIGKRSWARLLAHVQTYFPEPPPLRDVLKVRPRHLRFVWEGLRGILRGKS